jgi:hypothetical protein
MSVKMSEYDFSRPPHICRGSDLDPLNPEFKRGGIIPYLSFHGRTYYGLGIDSGYLTLIDFGGHREPDDTDIFETALREFQEESLGVFGTPTMDHCQDAMVVFNRNLVEIFLPLPSQDPFQIWTEFERRVQFEPHPENSAMVWLTGPEFFQAVRLNSPPMYPVLRKLLRDSDLWS